MWTLTLATTMTRFAVMMQWCRTNRRISEDKQNESSSLGSWVYKLLLLDKTSNGQHGLVRDILVGASSQLRCNATNLEWKTEDRHMRSHVRGRISEWSLIPTSATTGNQGVSTGLDSSNKRGNGVTEPATGSPTHSSSLGDHIQLSSIAQKSERRRCRIGVYPSVAS